MVNSKWHKNKQAAIEHASSFACSERQASEPWAEIRNAKGRRITHYFKSDGRLNYIEY